MYEEGKCAVTPCARRLPPSHLDVLITSASALTRARQLTYLLTSRYSCAHGALVGTTHAGFGDRQTVRGRRVYDISPSRTSALIPDPKPKDVRTSNMKFKKKT